MDFLLFILFLLYLSKQLNVSSIGISLLFLLIFSFASRPRRCLSLSLFFCPAIYILEYRVKLESDLIDCRDVIPLFIASVFARWTRRECTTEISSEKDRARSRLLLPSRRILSGGISRSPSSPTARLESPSPSGMTRAEKHPMTNCEILQTRALAVKFAFAENVRSLNAQTIARAMRSDASYVKESRRDANSLPDSGKGT